MKTSTTTKATAASRQTKQTKDGRMRTLGKLKQQQGGEWAGSKYRGFVVGKGEASWRTAADATAVTVAATESRYFCAATRSRYDATYEWQADRPRRLLSWLTCALRLLAGCWFSISVDCEQAAWIDVYVAYCCIKLFQATYANTQT